MDGSIEDVKHINISDLLIGDDDPYADDLVGVLLELVDGDTPDTLDLKITSSGLDIDDIIAVLTAAIISLQDDEDED